MIHELSNFRSPEPLKTDPAKRDRNKKCVYHKEHGHTTEQCRSLHYFVEKLIKAGHLKQYVRSEGQSGETSQGPSTATTSIHPRVMINYIHGGPIDEEYNSKRKRQRLLRVAFVREQVSFVQPGLTSWSTRLIDGMVSYLTEDGQINLYGSQLPAQQCYEVAGEAGSSSDHESPLKCASVADQ
ncbi:uncharacterized protein LOC117921773 [Vitis riparia]|uniref:uncharacterized protein LOC117921773 n=1 Tax=Vitis riparia TaxID=96939 RepID=UPI00155A8FEE|nr:uncharacterized protein LOC117921773 [Vitis riparia]